jgi:hypothetical protein
MRSPQHQLYATYKKINVLNIKHISTSQILGNHSHIPLNLQNIEFLIADLPDTFFKRNLMPKLDKGFLYCA